MPLSCSIANWADFRLAINFPIVLNPNSPAIKFLNVVDNRVAAVTTENKTAGIPPTTFVNLANPLITTVNP